MRRRLHILLFAVAVLLGGSASAQYYSWGADAPQRWSELRAPGIRIVAPDTAQGPARRLLRYLEAVRPTIGAGYRYGPMPVPFVLHPENFQSNGLVMWLPRRVEILSTPSVESYSMPWLKQLAAHEYRHAVQYNNLDRGWFRVASRILGQQGSVLSLLFMPVWALEGDAVMSETAMSSFGRALQPRFTLEYRALGDRLLEGRNVDKWFCGSYREMVPDHYRLGYQICSYAYDLYGENIWDKVTRYAVRNPYVIFTTTVGLRKYYGTSEQRLFRESFASLVRYWRRLPPQHDSAAPLTPLEEGNPTTYRWPLPLADTAVLALRSDYERPSRFVLLDRRTGRERRVAYTGSLSSRPDAGGGSVWWTEYRRSLLFDERVGSQLCRMDLAEGRPRRVRGRRRALYPTVAGDTLAAWVEYRPDGLYEVVRPDGTGGERRTAAPPGTELHGLAWDDATRALYVLATDDSGMWPGRVEEGGIRPLRAGAYVTLSDLRAAHGSLYFGSIASGRDEVHRLDLATGLEYRLTTSAYGSFEPAPDSRGDVLVTTYGRRGYAVALQEGGDADTVAFASLPRNVVNPPRRRWEAVNLDTVRFTAADSAESAARRPARRYRRGLHLLHVHSWMPAAFDPIGLIEEQNIWLNLGATLVAQNLLSSADGYLACGWNPREGSLVRGRLRYTGLGVQLDAGGSYGGDRTVYALQQTDPATGTAERQPEPSRARYWSVNANAVLPLCLQRGYHTRRLTLSAGWSYSNGLVTRLRDLSFDPATGRIANLGTVGYDRGVHKLLFGIGWSDAVRTAHRDLAPRWSYTLQADYLLNPTNRSFSDLAALYGQLRTPGLFAHHTFAVAAAWQTSLGGYRLPGSGLRPLGYRAARLVPRGLDAGELAGDRYAALSADYQLPLCYPEGGISGIVYFKRIRLNVGGDYALLRAADGARRHFWSCGGDLIFDINLLRQPASGTSTVRLSVYRPNRGGVWVGGGVGLPF